MPARISLVGKTFGRLFVIADGSTRQRNDGRGGRATSLCICQCGVELEVLNENLKGEDGTKSCGCWRKDSARVLHERHCHNRRGAQTGTYRCWASMLARCQNPETLAFPRYGGRGITVCIRWWLFDNFLSDMGERPVGLTLERLDNSKGYGPGNCAWRTPKQQARNTRQNRVMTVNGVTACMAELCEYFQINSETVRCRLKRGWDVNRAFLTPPRSLKKSIPQTSSL